MLPDQVEDHEYLYRAVNNRPNHWKPEENRFSSAAFYDGRGLSVDRDGEREEEDITRRLHKLKGDDCGIWKLKAGECRSIEEHPPVVEADPLNDNPYHALVKGSAENPKITRYLKNQLAKLAVEVIRPADYR